jgi:hypothetical protein
MDGAVITGGSGEGLDDLAAVALEEEVIELEADGDVLAGIDVKSELVAAVTPIIVLVVGLPEVQ